MCVTLRNCYSNSNNYNHSDCITSCATTASLSHPLLQLLMLLLLL